MKITEIKYTKKFNNGNYESEEYGVTAVLSDNDTETTVSLFQILKQEVHSAYTYTGEETQEPEPMTEEEVVEELEETPIEDEPTVEETPEEVEEEAEEEAEEEEELVSEKEVKAKKPKKKFKKKPQVYQRSNETHKEMFSIVLKGVAPNWKDNPKTKAKAKDCSVKMEGKEFLDENGKVLKEFVAEVKKLMK